MSVKSCPQKILDLSELYPLRQQRPYPKTNVQVLPILAAHANGEAQSVKAIIDGIGTTQRLPFIAAELWLKRFSRHVPAARLRERRMVFSSLLRTKRARAPPG